MKKEIICKQEITNELLDHDSNIMNYVVEKMVNELTKGIANVLSDGELYAIQMKKPEIDGLGALNFGQTVFSCEKDTPFGESNHEVVAWMPVIVPEPYKADGSE